MAIIQSRANILTRVQSKTYTEPSSFSSLFNLPYSKDIHYFSQARLTLQLSVESYIYTLYNYKIFPCVFEEHWSLELIVIFWSIFGDRMDNLSLIFWSIFGDRMDNLSLIDFKIGLYIKGNVTARQNKFEVRAFQFARNGHKLAQNRPDATFATWTLFGHNLVIFRPILTFFFF